MNRDISGNGINTVASMKKILLTGGTGLVGSDFISSASNDFIIYSLCRKSNPEQSGNVQYVEHDLTLPHLPSSMPEGIDTIIHLAQADNFRDFPDSATSIFNVNTYSTLLLLDWAAKNGVQRIIFASTGGLYGFESQLGKDGMLAEQDPMNFYFTSKFTSELMLKNYQNELIVVVARLFFPYGEKQKENMLMPRLVQNVCNDVPITLSGENGISINPIHVSDVSKILMKLTGVESSRYLAIAGEEILSLREIGNIIGARLGKPPKFQLLENKQGEDVIGDITGLRELGLEQTIPFKEGISSLCERFQKNGPN